MKVNSHSNAVQHLCFERRTHKRTGIFPMSHCHVILGVYMVCPVATPMMPFTLQQAGCATQALEDLSEDRREAWGAWLDTYRERLRAEGRSDAERRAGQDAVNPCYVARNQLMQTAIKDAEAGDYDEVRLVHLQEQKSRCCLFL